MKSAPWVASAFSYAGWVPNVGSHLSFSLIGSGQGPSVTQFTQGYDGRVGRMVGVMQRRETDDFLTFRWLSRLIWPEVVQHWLLVGSTLPIETHIGVVVEKNGKKKVQVASDEQGCLLGSVYLLPRNRAELPSDNWAIEGLRHLLRPSNRLGDKELDSLKEEIDRIVRWRVAKAIRVEFALMRSGELRLWYTQDVLDVGHDAKRLHLTARQAYFFIKDMVHDHTHHEPSSDQITPLVRVGTSLKRRSDGEEKWRRETVWSLSRAVEKLVRSGRLVDLRQAMGFLAYSDAFQKTLLPYVRNAKDPLRFDVNKTVYAYDYAHIKESNRVRIEQAQATRTQNISIGIASIASSIAAMSLLSSLVSTQNAQIEPNIRGVRAGLLTIHLPNGWLESFADRPWQVVLIVATIAVLASILASDLGERLLWGPIRKIGQCIRGLSLSIARRAGWNAWAAHFLLIAMYCLLGFIILDWAVGIAYAS